LSVSFENVDLIEKLDFFAFRDPLTHLANRTRFITEVDQDLYVRHQHASVLAVADIVGFSGINESLGYRSGDSLLIAVAKRLSGVVGAAVRLARVSGDCFGLYGAEDAIDPCALDKAFAMPFFVHGHAFTVRIRLGMVRVSDCEGNAAELLRNASLALSHLRRSGSESFLFFSHAMADDAKTQISMLHGLRAAIDFKRGLSLVYQPMLNARTNDVVGVEALLRWRNERGEIVAPKRFIPLAERTGMIHELGAWVFEQALNQYAYWSRQGGDKLCLSVNVSMVQLQAHDFPARLQSMLEFSDIDPTRLHLEIGEDICVYDTQSLRAQLGKLRALGVHLNLDDFGAEFSPIGKLIDLPVTAVKLAASFTSQIEQRADGPGLIASLVVLAQECGCRVVAKQVETREQMQMLLDAGCEHMQGFYFAKPMPPEHFRGWLLEQKKRLNS
jgi:diguanylate cyclase (GGDEF)-like protein